MKYRVATAKDIPQLRRVDTVSAAQDEIDGKRFYVLRKKGVLDYFIKCKGLLVVEDTGRIVGYVLTHPVDWMHGTSKMIWIEHIGVHPQYRRKGIALGLLKFVRSRYRAKAKQLYAEIHPLNAKSIALFRKFGAELIERKLAFKRL